MSVDPAPQSVTILKRPPLTVHAAWQVLFVTVITGDEGAGQVPGSVVSDCIVLRHPDVLSTHA